MKLDQAFASLKEATGIGDLTELTVKVLETGTSGPGKVGWCCRLIPV